ncbi:MAG: hypothetical protein ACRCUT_14425, partial [Spirochaetota bacterium]
KIKLSLTDKGIKASERIQDDFDRYLESLISHLSEKEKKEFFESLTGLSKYINKIMEGSKKGTVKPMKLTVPQI